MMLHWLTRLRCHFGYYQKFTSADGLYYYICGPGLTPPRFAVIHPRYKDLPGVWTIDWISHKPLSILWFCFWKLNLRVESAAEPEEVEWYRCFMDKEQARERIIRSLPIGC